MEETTQNLEKQYFTNRSQIFIALPNFYVTRRIYDIFSKSLVPTTHPSTYFLSIHFERKNFGFQIQQRQWNRELWQFSFKMTVELLKFFECSFIHIGICVTLQPSDFCMQVLKQQLCKVWCNGLNCRYQTLQIRAKPFIRSKQYASSDKTDTYRFGGFLPLLAIPRFLHPTGQWIYKQYITGITANNYDVYTYNAALHRSPPEDSLAGEHLWKRILAYTHLGRPRTGGTASTGTARPLCILRRSRKSSPFCRR